MMNWPFLIATQAKRPNPALARPTRRWRDGNNFAGMRLGGVPEGFDPHSTDPELASRCRHMT